MLTRLGAIALTLLACFAARADDPDRALSRDDFAYGIELEVTAGLPVQTALVPIAVYRGVLRPDLGDVRVLNAQGAVLPHAVRKLAPVGVEAPREERERAVPVFPLRAAVGARAALDQLSLRIERGAGGSVIDIQSEAGADAGAPSATRVVAYVLDTQAIDSEMQALRIELSEPLSGSEPSYIASLAIDASDDLASWRTLPAEGALAWLEHGGRRVLRDRVELPATRAKFLRVRTADGGELPRPIAQAFIEVAPEAAPPAPRERLTVTGEGSASEPGIYDYDLGGALPVDRVRVSLPSPGTLIQAELSVAAAKGETEQPPKISAIRARTNKRIYDDVYVGPLYRLQEEGRELESPPIDLDGRRIRYLSLATGERASLEAPPRLEVEYAPAQLLFVARDPGPFELVFGSHTAPAPKLGPEALLSPLSRQARERLPVSSVQFGEQRTISGERALTPPPPPPPLEKYALWAVLIAGTLGVTALAVRLLRKLD